MKALIIYAVMVLIWFIVGSVVEAMEIITKPDYWALYGFIFGSALTALFISATLKLTSRLDNKTDDFIQLKHWDTRKDGIK